MPGKSLGVVSDATYRDTATRQTVGAGDRQNYASFLGARNLKIVLFFGKPYAVNTRGLYDQKALF